MHCTARVTAHAGLFLALALATLASGCVSVVRRVPYQPASLQDLLGERGRVAELQRRFAGSALVSLLAEDVLEHALLPGGSYWTLHHTSIRRHLVLDEHSAEATSFQLVVQDAQLAAADLVVVPPEGEPRRYAKEDLIRQDLGGGAVSYKLAYPAVRRGTLIETRVDLDHGDQAASSAQGFNTLLALCWPCLHRRVIFAYPDAWPLQVKVTGLPNGTPARELREDTRVLLWEARDLPARERERFAPFPREDQPYLAVALGRVRVGTAAHWAPATWSELGDAFRQTLDALDPALPLRLLATARGLAALQGDALARATAVISHLQRALKLDDGDEQRDVEDVLRDGKGGALQITALAMRLLKELGIATEFLFIHPETMGRFDPRFVALPEGWVPALRLRDAPGFVALPHRRFLPPGLLPGALQGRPALCFDTEGYLGTVKTPSFGPDDGRVELTTSVRLQASGEVTIEETQRYSGLESYRMRRELDRLGRDAFVEGLRARLRADGLELSSTRLRRYASALEIALSYRAPRHLALAGDTAILRTEGLLSSRAQAEGPRRQEVHLHQARRVHRRFSLRWPAGWVLRTTLEDRQVRNALGHASARWTRADGLALEQELTLRRVEAPRSSHGELRTLLGVGGRVEVPSLVFATRPSPASAPASRAAR